MDEVSPRDAPIDGAEDSRWMSIAELAKSRRISKASAWKLVTRRGWQRLKGNDGTIRIYVPRGQEQPQTDVPKDVAKDTTPDSAAVIAAKDEHIADLRLALGRAEARADDLQAQLDQWRMAGWWRRRRLRRARGR